MKKLSIILFVFCLVGLFAGYTKKANAYSNTFKPGNYEYIYYGSYDNKYNTYYTQHNTSASYAIGAYPYIFIQPTENITFNAVRLNMNCSITTATSVDVSISVLDNSCVDTGIQSATTTLPCYGANPYVYDYLFVDTYFYFSQDINFSANSTTTLKINVNGDKTKITRQFGNTAAMSGNQRIGLNTCSYSSFFASIDLYNFSLTTSNGTTTPSQCPFINRISKTLFNTPAWITYFVAGTYILLFSLAYYASSGNIRQH
jgi:hypothetical protein